MPGAADPHALQQPDHQSHSAATRGDAVGDDAAPPERVAVAGNDGRPWRTLDVVADPVAVLDPDGVVAWINEAWRAANMEVHVGTSLPAHAALKPLGGLAAGTESFGNAVREALDGVRDGRAAAREVLQPFAAPHGAIRAVRVRLVPIDGHLVVILRETSGEAPLESSGATEGRLGSEVARRLRKRLMARGVDPVAYVYDERADRFLDVGPHAEALLGRPRGDWMQPGFTARVVHPEDHAVFASRPRLAASEVEPVVDFRLLRPDGSAVWVRDFLASTDPASGTNRILEGAMADVSERRVIEQALRSTEARVQSALENAPFGMWICDGEGRIILQSPISRQRWGDLQGRRVEESELPEEIGAAWAASITRALGGQADRREFRWTVDGEVRVLDQTASPVREGGRVIGVLGVKIDITDRLRTEQDLRQRNELERLLFRELDHRVRNNLSALLAMVEFSRRRAASVVELADSIVSRTRTMAAVHSLLHGTHWTAVRFSSLLSALVQPEHAAKVRVEGAEVVVPPRQVTAMGMVLNELLTNSSKHGALSGDGGRVTVHLAAATAQADASKVIIEWRESGGPPIVGTPGSGSGTELMTGLLRAELRGAIELGFPPDGARHRIVVRFDLPYPAGDAAQQQQQQAHGGAVNIAALATADTRW